MLSVYLLPFTLIIIFVKQTGFDYRPYGYDKVLFVISSGDLLLIMDAFFKIIFLKCTQNFIRNNISTAMSL